MSIESYPSPNGVLTSLIWRKTGCRCTHGESCYKGWIDFEGASYTVPCGVCRADLRDALAKVPPLGEREQHHYESIRNRHRV